MITFSFLSVANAAYTFLHKRAYRLFEFPIDAEPSTPSAHRVEVDPTRSSSPSTFLQTFLGSAAPESRAHPNPTQHVWEVNVWDPPALCLKLFCLFSPGHVMVYWLFLPTTKLDPRPSVTVVTTMFLALLLSVQLSFLSNSFIQKAHDDRIISKEVMREYDTKFVHPSLNRPSRDVGIQADMDSSEDGGLPKDIREVDLYSPRFIINKGFRVNPNPNYAAHYDKDNALQQRPQPHRRQSTTPSLHTPANPVHVNYQAPQAPDSSPLRPPTAIKQPVNPFRAPSSPEKRTGDGGNLGVYSHANSPLRKATSNPYLRTEHAGDHSELKKRGGSPLKRMSTPGGLVSGQPVDERKIRQYRGLDGGRRESGRF